MQQSPDRRASDGALEPTLQVLENLVPAELHAAAWAECQSPHWRFGHGSTLQDSARFWTMELRNNQIFDDVWRQAQDHCEMLAGTPLRVIRQYANGHTYGLGGAPHTDDARPGTFTLLYYPNPQWKESWDGETIFYDSSGEIARAVRPRPNRGVFFDSRLLHVGRPPSRLCPELRVTVAYKLEAVPADPVPLSRHMTQHQADVREISRDGASRVYAVRVPEAFVDDAIDERLSKLGQSIRLPGFPPGEIPRELVKERYGAQTRRDVLKQLAVQTLETNVPAGNIVSSCDLRAGAEFGDMELRVQATYLPDLPLIDRSRIEIERFRLEQGEPPPAASAVLRRHLKSQVLDQLDLHYQFPLFPGIIEREFSGLWHEVQAQEGVVEADVRATAARRVRSRIIILEVARRLGFDTTLGAELEDMVVDYFVAGATTRDRLMTAAELQEMIKTQGRR